jgi:hypothetical protein
MIEPTGSQPMYPQQQPSPVVAAPVGSQVDEVQVQPSVLSEQPQIGQVQSTNGSFFSAMNLIKVGILLVLVAVIAFASWHIFVPAYEIHVSDQPFNPEGITVDKIVVRRDERIMVVMFSASNLLPGVPISFSSSAGKGTYEDLFFPIRYDEELGPPTDDLPKQGDTVFLAIVKDIRVDDEALETHRNIVTDFFGNPYMVSIKLE